ncbi:MAG TPA: hypothetical protein VMP01_09260 [Pirellulaceae bacterium]|nr:hypothetical protein [Pirellulaceae bacterium]
MVHSLLLVSALALAQADGKAADAPAEKTKAAAAAPSAELAPKVKALIRQLDSDQQAKREAAEKELVALGEDVLPLLPPITRTTPAEVKNRLGRVRKTLMDLAIAATTKPKFVTLSGEMLLSEALAEIEKQTGNRVTDSREEDKSDPKITLQLDKAPFWEALDTILDAAQLTLYNYDTEQGELSYIARDENALPRIGRGTYSAIFRLEPTRIEIDADLRNPASKALRLTVDAAWEPRVRPVVIMLPVGQFQATDDGGNAVEVDSGDGDLEFSVDGFGAGVELVIPFKIPARTVKQIASIKGKLTAVLLGREETYEFPNPESKKGAEEERGGVTVILDQCRKVDELLEARMRVKFDKASNALESHRGWIYNNPCYLEDAKGDKVEQAALEATLLDENEVAVIYRFDLGDEANASKYKLVYKTPAAIIEVPVEFELKAIDLP